MWFLRFDLLSRVHRAACTLAAAAVLFCGGCASQHASNQRADAAAAPTQAAQAPRRGLIEDDGLPSQLAPRDMRSVPDDPNEPWSPNYGTRPRAKEITPSRAPAPVETGPTRVATVDADTLVRRAIAEHEMQRQ